MRPLYIILMLLILWLGTTQGVVTAQKPLPMERFIRHQDTKTQFTLIALWFHLTGSLSLHLL